MNQTILSVDSKGRKLLNITAKRSIIELGENGLSHQKIAAIFGIGRSTVTKILLNKESILDLISDDLSDSKTYNKKSPLYELEVELFQWSVEGISFKTNERDLSLGCSLARKVSKSENKFKNELNKEDLIIKAKQLAPQFGLYDFEPTNEWFKKFKRRFNIRFRRYPKLHSESSIDLISNTNLKVELQRDIDLSSNTTCNYIVESNIPADFKLENLNRNILLNNSQYYSATNSFEHLQSSIRNQSLCQDFHDNSYVNYNQFNINAGFNFSYPENTKVLSFNPWTDSYNIPYNSNQTSAIFPNPYLFNHAF